ncbi:MAG: A/G-specific adenine glycosylase [Clostridia bacterium]|nr:A/G-specific adenine glycosylase [Clostridia bacterium]
MKTTDFDFQLVPAPLLAWYNANKRDLEWRVNPTSYRVWVSEIMLQQTRVEAVKEYYARFMRELPTLQALATCEEEKLLKLWEGLGYYSRVRNMQKAAKEIVERFGGEFPSDEKSLKSLPGIGAYTVGAIRSIAFGLRAPAVDGNVFRVASRLSENPTVISDPAYRKYLEEKLLAVYPEEGEDCSAFTQSLMELGALICKPQTPDCRVCPLNGICRANAHGTQNDYPVLPEKKAKKAEKRFVFLIRTKEGISLRKRKEGVLKGMTEFPSESAIDRTPEELLNEWGVGAFKVVKRKTYAHIFTHIRWEMDCILVDADHSPFESRTLEEIRTQVSIPTAFKQCLSLLE